MNNIVSCKLMGGLGNYLFQIAATYAYSLNFSKDFSVDVSDTMVVHKPVSNYLDHIFRKIKFVSNYNNYVTHNSSQPIQYAEIPSVEGNLKLLGYYQNEKYFKHIHNDILKLYEIDNETLNYLNSKYINILDAEICSLHIRRGDYLTKPDFHTIPLRQYDSLG